MDAFAMRNRLKSPETRIKGCGFGPEALNSDSTPGMARGLGPG